MPRPTPQTQLPDNDQLFRLLRQLDTAPDASQRATAQALPEPICWRVDRFALVSSTQVSDPPRYRVLRTWPLGN